MADHTEVATRIVSAHCQSDKQLIDLIAVALQEAFDMGFEAAGGQIIPLGGQARTLPNEERG